MITTILLVFAFVFFVFGTFFGPTRPDPNTAWYGRFNVVSAGLACWVMSELMARSGLLGK